MPGHDPVPTPRKTVLAALAATLWLVGCSVLRQGTEKVVDAGLEAVNTDDNRARVEELLTSKQLKDATRELTGVVLEAAVADLTDKGRADRIQQIAVDFVEDLVPALSTSFDDEVWPGVRGKLEEAVTVVLEQVLSDTTLDRARTFAADTASAAIAATAPDIVETVSEGIGRGLEAALVAVIQGQVVPVLKDLMDRDSGPKVADLARQTAHGALLGVADAMNGEFGDVFDRERDEILAKLRDSTSPVLGQFKTGLIVLIVLLAIGLIVILQMYRQRRQRDEALELILGLIVKQGYGADDLLKHVRDTGRSTSGAAYLNTVLDKHGPR